MVGLVQCPKLAQSIRDQSRVLAGLKLRPESYRAAPSASAPTPVAPSAAPTSGPRCPTAASLSRALSTRPPQVQAAAPSPSSRRAFSSTPSPNKALAQIKEGEALQKTPYLPQGRAAANAQESKTGESDDARTLNTPSLAGKDPSLVSQWSEATPFGPIGGSEEIEGAAALLAVDASQFTAGTDLVIDGGFSLV